MDNFNIDYDRENRLGFPEIIYGESKDLAQLLNILKDYKDKSKNALITKLQAEKAAALKKEMPEAFYDHMSGIFALSLPEPKNAEAEIAILSGGTSDQFIVNEIFYTLQYLGHSATILQDIGVSGLHRLLSRVEEISKFKILIVVAGFEGALPTVVGGLLSQPIIAVPTRVGYGVASEGQIALGTMLSSCANGITVVNIDNGYGAAMAAVRIINMIRK